MTTSDRILLALQPDASAADLLAHAAAWAGLLGLRIDLCAVLPGLVASDPLHLSAGALGASETAVDDQRRVAAWLADQLDDLPPELRGNGDVRLGDPAAEIRDCSADYALLMVGTHHRRDLARLLLGSVAETLVRTAHCPVLVLPPARRAVPEAPVVHLPLDPADPQLQAIEWVRDHLPSAALTAVYRLPLLETFDPRASATTYDEADTRLRTALEEAGHEDLARLVIVREDTTLSGALAHEAQGGDVDLIALPTHGRTGLAHLLFGSVSEQLVRSADCAVLVVR
ncbi:MAG: universal stress protein [Myxococcota bacterium]